MPLRVRGDSMADRIAEGDVVLLQRRAPERQGETCAVRAGDDESTLEYLAWSGPPRRPARYRLRPHNPADPTLEVAPGLTVELAAPERLPEAVGPWDARRQHEAAADAVLERYPHALVRVRWDDPHAPAADRVWRWAAPEGGARPVTSGPGDPTAARRARGRPAQALLEVPLGAVPPAALHGAPPIGTRIDAGVTRTLPPDAPAAPLPSPAEAPARTPGAAPGGALADGPRVRTACDR